MLYFVTYIFAVPLIYLVALLPFPLLYWLSNFVYFILYYVTGYRKKVVYANLKNSFPEKSDDELRLLVKKHYRYFADLLLEVFKTLTISPETLKKRVSFKDKEIFERFYSENRSVIVVMGHMGNWELAGARFALENLHQLYVIYHPLSNPYFEKLVYHMRTRLGNKLYPMKDTLRGMLANKNHVTATAFIADQTPSPKGAYWTTFLNQHTPVFNGTAKIAKKLNYPIIYISVTQQRRGYYTIGGELLIENPESLSEDDISELHAKRLEQDIYRQPEIWLWSHRRWKHKANH